MEDKNFSASNEHTALIGRFVKTSKEELIVDGAASTVDITPLGGHASPKTHNCLPPTAVTALSFGMRRRMEGSAKSVIA